MKRIVKVCGMREARNIAQVDALGVDLMGFIFYRPSIRYVSSLPELLPHRALRVGVFVNAPIKEISATAGMFSLDYIQLHGTETPQECMTIRDMGFRVIKAFSVTSGTDFERTAKYNGLCDMFLFDTGSGCRGGSGVQFDWNLLDRYDGETPFLLSGGIDVESASRLACLNHSRLAGYDINSRFETAPAVKNVSAISEFLDLTGSQSQTAYMLPVNVIN